jgi:hypothetical protein
MTPTAGFLGAMFTRLKSPNMQHHTAANGLPLLLQQATAVSCCLHVGLITISNGMSHPGNSTVMLSTRALPGKCVLLLCVVVRSSQHWCIACLLHAGACILLYAAYASFGWIWLTELASATVGRHAAHMVLHDGTHVFACSTEADAHSLCVLVYVTCCCCFIIRALM